jgi:hypothetical protein
LGYPSFFFSFSFSLVVIFPFFSPILNRKKILVIFDTQHSYFFLHQITVNCGIVLLNLFQNLANLEDLKSQLKEEKKKKKKTQIAIKVGKTLLKILNLGFLFLVSVSNKS